MKTSSKYRQIGSENAPICFYLPSEPVLPGQWHYTDDDALARLIELNGNHWRKILTIMAKICAPDSNWKPYRERQLLKGNEQLRIGADRLSDQAQIHLISGLESAANVGIYSDACTPAVEGEDRLLAHSSALLVPYLDYRQYPNRLIEETRNYLSAHTRLRFKKGAGSACSSVTDIPALTA